VAAAAYGDLEVVVAREAHGCDHVCGPVAAGDQPRAPVDDAVPHGSGGVVLSVVSRD